MTWGCCLLPLNPTFSHRERGLMPIPILSAPLEDWKSQCIGHSKQAGGGVLSHRVLIHIHHWDLLDSLLHLLTSCCSHVQQLAVPPTPEQHSPLCPGGHCSLCLECLPPACDKPGLSQRSKVRGNFPRERPELERKFSFLGNKPVDKEFKMKVTSQERKKKKI